MKKIARKVWLAVHNFFKLDPNNCSRLSSNI